MTMESTEVKLNFREDTLHKNTAPRTEPIPLTTSDIIIPASDQVVEKSYEQIIHDGVEGKMKAFDGWLGFKVKTELIAQIFTNVGSENWQIDIGSVFVMLKKEISNEKNVNFQSANELENTTIPLAISRDGDEKTKDPTKTATFYKVKDVDNLWARAAIHSEISMRLNAIEETGDEGIYDLSEVYIQQLYPMAKSEALRLALLQKQELEAAIEQSVRANRAKITNLESTISELRSQIDDQDGIILEQAQLLYSSEQDIAA
jgi:hypothetical protein